MESQTSTNLTYDVYNSNSFAVRGDKELYSKKMKKIKGTRWNSRLKDGAGWLVPRTAQAELDAIIKATTMTQKLANMQGHAKPRKEQKKYRRAISGDEYSSAEEVEEKPVVKKHRKRSPSPKRREDTPIRKHVEKPSSKHPQIRRREDTSEDDDIENMPLEKIFSDRTSPQVLNFYKKFR